MGNHTSIQWTDGTANPSTGCDGCELHVRGKGGPCYAGNYHEQRMAKALPRLYAPTFTDVRLAPGRMAQAASWADLRGKIRPDKPWIPPELPRLIFVSDMSDALSASVPFAYLKTEIIDTVRSPKGQRHIWQWLTKRPSRMADFAWYLIKSCGLEWPDNLWVGTSITSQASVKRVAALCRVPAKVRFLSVEPLLEAVDLTHYLPRDRYYQARCEDCQHLESSEFFNILRLSDDSLIICPECGSEQIDLDATGIHQVLIGGESAQRWHHARPFDIQWARDLIRQCRDAGVAPFMKQLGSNPRDSSGAVQGTCDGTVYLSLKDSHGGDWDEWPADLRVREFPAWEVAHA